MQALNLKAPCYVAEESSEMALGALQYPHFGVLCTVTEGALGPYVIQNEEAQVWCLKGPWCPARSTF